MRARVIALGLSGLLAAGPAAVLVSPAAAQKKPPPKVGQACNPKKKPPKGFTCKKGSKGGGKLVKAPGP
jgi:hypothetical protein